jgi:hypothetical protein
MATLQGIHPVCTGTRRREYKMPWLHVPILWAPATNPTLLHHRLLINKSCSSGSPPPPNCTVTKAMSTVACLTLPAAENAILCPDKYRPALHNCRFPIRSHSQRGRREHSELWLAPFWIYGPLKSSISRQTSSTTAGQLRPSNSCACTCFNYPQLTPVSSR